MRIVAFDLSLTATGWASVDRNIGIPKTIRMLDRFGIPQVKFGVLHPVAVTRIATSPMARQVKLVGMERLDVLRTRVQSKVLGFKEETGIDKEPKAAFVIMEDLAYSAHDTYHERAGLAYLVRHRLFRLKVPYVLVAPTTLKKFVTGSGRAEKSQMMKAVYKDFQVDVSNDNEADAVGLAILGAMLAGLMKPRNKNDQAVLKTVEKNLSGEMRLLLETNAKTK